MEALVWLGGSRATAALEHAGLSGLPLGRAMTEMAAYAAAYAATHKHNIPGWPGTQRGTNRARTDGADRGGTRGDYDKDVKLSEGLAASLGKGKYAKQSDLTRGARRLRSMRAQRHHRPDTNHNSYRATRTPIQNGQ